MLLSLLLSSCSTQTPQKKIKQEKETSENIPLQPLSAEQSIALAKQAINTNVNADVINSSIINLVNASQLYLQEQKYHKALWLAEQTLQLSSKSAPEVSVRRDHNNLQTMQLLLIKAHSYSALNRNELSYQELEKILALSQQYNLKLSFDYYQLNSQVLEKKNRTIAALQASLFAFSLNAQQSNEAIEEARQLLWQKIKRLSPWQVELLTKKEAPNLDGWLQLNQYASKFGDNDKQFSRYLFQWQRQYPNHPAIAISEHLLQQTLTQNEIENIAVILPLTGKQRNAGLAVQQGILAAYEQQNVEQDTEKTLHFFDSNTLDWQSLPNKLNEEHIDFVIGPLLKSHLNRYLELNLSSANTNEQANTIEDEIDSEQALSIPALLLNLPSQQTLAANQVAFSMRPEDEAIQAAATLSQVGFKQAIVLSHQDKVSQRIALAFVKQWQEKTDQLLEIVYFEQGKAMQNNLKASLDVKASQTRIDELKSRLKQTIKAQTRNRRDVDMIYVVGSAQQTRLVKPYIDVNISPFASLIPVYASSRSHSIKNDSSSANDLQGLTFTEIPWLLKSADQNKGLAVVSAQLWPKRSDSLSRIFAMGFDSYNLVNKLNLMQQAPYIRHYGQTGVLQLSDNILTRSLIWGRYQQKGVNQVTLQ